MANYLNIIGKNSKSILSFFVNSLKRYIPQIHGISRERNLHEKVDRMTHGMRRARGTWLLLLTSLLLAREVGASNSSYDYALRVNGYDRIARIYTPSDTTVPSPVLFYFHGYTGTIEDSDSNRHFQTYWPEAIIVYAEGRFPYNANQPEAGWRIRFPYINEVCGENEDLIYIDDIMEHLRTNYVIDENRIYASGHSSGAFFTLALMELKPDLFTGFAMLGAYSRFRVDASGVDCSDDTDWTSAIPLELSPNDHSAIPRPVLYMFGSLENFDYDRPDQLRSFSTSCNEDSRFRNTVDELLIRNRCTIPSCEPDDRSPYIKTMEKQIFEPTSADGAETQIWLYGGGHSWEDFPGDAANQTVVDYFKSLAPRWEINYKGSLSFGAWEVALDAGIPRWENTVFADFDGDGNADAFERQVDGVWKIRYMEATGFETWHDVGSAGSTQLEDMRFADFDGDGRTDVYRRLDGGYWQINYMGSNNDGTRFGAWHDVGSAGSTQLDDMRFADFDGDGRTDVYRRLDGGYWQINYMGSNNDGTRFGAWHDVGSAGSTQLDDMRFADFDGDGRTDVYRRLDGGYWQINYMGSNNDGTRFGAWHDVGSAGSTQLDDMRFADFDGDGRTDVYRRLDGGYWQINYMGSNNDGTRFGAWHDVGSAGSTQLDDMRFADFDGDGKTDVVRLID